MSQRSLQVDVPEEVIEASDGYVTIIASPTKTSTARRFKEWFLASCMPGDVWKLVNIETGEVEEEHHAE